MKQIAIGTCIPGNHVETWLPPLVGLGMECVAINFHMSLEGADLTQLGPRVQALLEDSGAHVSTVGYYCNALMNPDHQATLEKVIDTAHLFGAHTVSTFAGALEGQPVEAALPAFKKVFSELARRAEDRGVRIAIENCPMDGTWRSATCNIGFNPKAWELMFDAVPSDALGLEWEPAHAMGQLIDPIAQLRRWVKKVVHVHGKDATIQRDLIAEQGVMGPEAPVLMRTPGFGDTDWRQVFTILYMSGYQGDICIEGYHDPIYGGEWETTGQIHALQYLKWCRGGSFTPNAWSK